MLGDDLGAAFGKPLVVKHAGRDQPRELFLEVVERAVVATEARLATEGDEVTAEHVHAIQLQHAHDLATEHDKVVVPHIVNHQVTAIPELGAGGENLGTEFRHGHAQAVAHGRGGKGVADAFLDIVVAGARRQAVARQRVVEAGNLRAGFPEAAKLAVSRAVLPLVFLGERLEPFEEFRGEIGFRLRHPGAVDQATHIATAGLERVVFPGGGLHAHAGRGGDAPQARSDRLGHGEQPVAPLFYVVPHVRWERAQERNVTVDQLHG